MNRNFAKVALVGRPNVGKSTLFNRLVGRRQAIVEDIPGVTRDRQYGLCEWEGNSFNLIDTGGLIPGVEENDIARQIGEQVQAALEESDCVIFLVDGRVGCTPADEEIARFLRKQKIPIVVAVNKIDQIQQLNYIHDFSRLGIQHIIGLSAETSLGVSDLLGWINTKIKLVASKDLLKADLKIAIMGQPNVGKSTLLNALLGESRAVVHPTAGTTLDPLSTYIEEEDQVWEFVDTAGIRRKTKASEKIEKVSVIKSLQVMAQVDLVLLMVDASQGMHVQDARILNYAEEKARGLIIIFNKWDLVEKGTSIESIRQEVYERFPKQRNIPLITLSAKNKNGFARLKSMIKTVATNFHRRISTGELNRVFQEAIRMHPHPSQSGKHINLSYITQVHEAPPRFLIFCNFPDKIQSSYMRYLERIIYENFEFTGVPLQWSFKKKSSREFH
ncbi:MAG: ribosome biogenesis GTPase Der [Deltaproteobacteria bacterium]|nr:ribosome biogenesis GTPase Der [Deltaproteobacteria bacterium]